MLTQELQCERPALAATLADTGEVVAEVGVSAEQLRRRAAAEIELDAMRVALDRRLAEIESADPELAALRDQIREAEALIRDTDQTLGAAIPDDARSAGSIVIDLGVVRVCWPAPARRWRQARSPAEIARTSPALARRLGIEQVVYAPEKPRITIRRGQAMFSGNG